MQTNETLLVLGMLVLISLALLTTNDIKLDSSKTIMESELMLAATLVAQSFIEEASQLAYDEKTASLSFEGALPESFTNINSLGPEHGEHYPAFDDVDDYNGLSQSIATPRGEYNVNIDVFYSSDLNAELASAAKEFFKIMKVNVSSIYYPDTLTVSYLYSFR